MGLAFYVMKVGMGRQCKEEEKEEGKGKEEGEQPDRERDTQGVTDVWLSWALQPVFI